MLRGGGDLTTGQWVRLRDRAGSRILERRDRTHRRTPEASERSEFRAHRDR